MVCKILAVGLPAGTYPEDPESWSESLTPSEGFWFSDVGQVVLDTVIKYSGMASIQATGVFQTGFYVRTGFQLYDGKEFDATRTNSKFRFSHCLEMDKFTGQCLFILFDVDDRLARKSFGTSPLGHPYWEHKEFDIDPNAPWDQVDSGFDFSRIKGFLIDAGPSADGKQWVDVPYFSYGEVVEGTLVIESTPTGKSGTFTDTGGSYQFITPSQVTRLVGTPCVISMDPLDFEHWEDGSTNPERAMVIQEGTTKITATYTTAVNPLLRISSLDQNLKNLYAENGVRLIYRGIEQYVDVPFAARVSKGEYTFIAEETEDQIFEFWKKPDGSTTTEKYITVDIQGDTQIEVHWKKKGLPPTEEWVPYAVAASGIGLILTALTLYY